MAERSRIFAAPGTSGHSATLRQSRYSPSIPARDRKGLSSYRKTNSPSAEQLGQYIRRTDSKVVGSNICMPRKDASFRAMGSYSSAVHGSSNGATIRSLGAAPSCFLVLYTA